MESNTFPTHYNDNKILQVKVYSKPVIKNADYEQLM